MKQTERKPPNLSAEQTVADSYTGRSSNVIVRFSQGGVKCPLFLIHGVDGGLRHIESLANHLSMDRPLYGIQSAAMAGCPAPYTTIPDMARFYLAELQKLQTQGPYYLLGYSFGGYIAYEIAQILHRAGETVAFLGMIDTLVMGSPEAKGHAISAGQSLKANSSPILDHFRKLISLGGLSYAAEKIIRRGFRFAYMTFDRMRRPVPRFLQRAHDLNWYAGSRYRPQPYAGKVVLFLSSESVDDGRAMIEAWQRLAQGGAEVRVVEGKHADFLWEPSVRLLAASVTGYLADRP